MLEECPFRVLKYLVYFVDSSLERRRTYELGFLREIIEMKVRASVKKICEKCKIIKRRGILRVVCENPKHKQKQG